MASMSSRSRRMSGRPHTSLLVLVCFLGLLQTHIRFGGGVHAADAAGGGDSASTDLDESARDKAYEVLGLNKWASEAEVRKAFKDKSLILHPDKGVEASEEGFDELRQAYEALIDPERRIVLDELDGKAFETIDEYEAQGSGGSVESGMSDFYEQSRNIVKFTTGNILSLLARKNAWVVEYYVPWCVYCQKMTKTYKKLVTQFASSEVLRFGAVNCMSQQTICDRYPFQVVPTFMCFHSDKDHHIFEGIPDEGKIERFIQKCQDDYEEHLRNGDDVYDKFMYGSESSSGEAPDLDADDYDYDLTSDEDGGDPDTHEDSIPPSAEKEAATPSVVGDSANEGDAEDDDEYDYELVDETEGGDDDIDADSSTEEAIETDDYDYDIVDGADAGDGDEILKAFDEFEPEAKEEDEITVLREKLKAKDDEVDSLKERLQSLEQKFDALKSLFS